MNDLCTFLHARHINAMSNNLLKLCLVLSTKLAILDSQKEIYVNLVSWCQEHLWLCHALFKVNHLDAASSLWVTLSENLKMIEPKMQEPFWLMEKEVWLFGGWLECSADVRAVGLFAYLATNSSWFLIFPKTVFITFFTPSADLNVRKHSSAAQRHSLLVQLVRRSAPSSVLKAEYFAWETKKHTVFTLASLQLLWQLLRSQLPLHEWRDLLANLHLSYSDFSEKEKQIQDELLHHHSFAHVRV